MAYDAPHEPYIIDETDWYDDRSDWTENTKRYASLITHMDRAIGRLVERLESLGLRENTIIMFASDNGAAVQAPIAELGCTAGFRGRKGQLYDHFENPALLEILPEYNTRLCQVGALLISYRARFYDSLGKAAAVYHNQFSGGAEEFLLEYKTVSTVRDPFASVSQLTQDLLDHLERHYRAEIESGQCLTGPHKDDFEVSLSGIDLKAYGSQGQTRTAAISLKLAQRELMAREWGEEPVLLLDDVLSELDQGRQDFVLNQIVSGQVFITCCEPGRFTKLGKTIEIEKGHVK